MAFIDTPRVKQLVTSISDETVSIEDFFTAAIEQNPKTEKNVRPILNVLLKEGIDVKQPWTSLANEETVNTLLQSEHTNSATFTNLQAIERETRTFYNKNKGAVKGLARYPFSDDSVRITGDGGIARSFGKRDDNPKAYQVRGTQKFRKVPEAFITIPKILEAISVVKDDATRAALTFNVLIPFRPGEVAELLIEDIDFDTGYIAEYTRGNKTRPGLRVPKVALEILRDAAEDAKAKGSDKVFSGVTVNKMTTALKKEGKIVKLFKGSKATLGREIKGVKDLRKLVPSVLALELGKDAGVISQLLGHEEIGAIIADLNNMTKGHYVSPVDVDENAATEALETIQNIVGKNTNAQTLNEIPLAFRVSATNLTQEGAEQFDIPLDIVDQVGEPRVVTPEDLEMQEARRKLNLSRIQKETADTDIETENKRLEALERKKVADAATTDDLIGGIEKELDTRDNISKKIQELEAKPDKTERELSVIEELRKKAKVKPEAPKPADAVNYVSPRDEASSERVNKFRELLKSRHMDRIKGGIKSAAIGAAALLGPMKFAKAAEIGAEVAAEAFTPTPIGEPIQSDPSSFEDAQLLQAMQSGARTADLTPVSDIAAREARTRLDTLLPKAEKADQKGRARRARIMAKDRARKLETGLQNRATDLEEEYQGFAMRQLP